MAHKLSKKNKIIIDHYLKLLKNDIRLKSVLLFGSFAYGKPSKHSDIDLIIVSPDFKKMDFSERMDWLQLKRDKTTFQLSLDLIGYTPKEFAGIEKYSATMAKAKKDGQWLYQK